MFEKRDLKMCFFHCSGTMCDCIQNQFIIDFLCCCSEHVLATNEELIVFLSDFLTQLLRQLNKK